MNNPSQSPTILLRGTGLLSALGADPVETLAALREGESAIFPDANNNPCGAIPDIDTQRWLGGPPGLLDRGSLLMLVACAQALEESKLDPKTFPYGRFGVMAGTVWGGIQSAALFYRDAVEKGPRLVKPLLFPHTYGNTGVSLAAMRWNRSGPHGCPMTGRVASGQAFAEAVAELRARHADAMLVVGSESFSAQRSAAVAAAALEGEAPTSRRVVLGESGAACVLARADENEKTGVIVKSARCGQGVEPVIRAALEEANLTPAELSLVVTSARGCPDADRLESDGLRAVLNGVDSPTLSPLTLCGELEGANAVFLAAVASLCLRHNIGTPNGGNALVLATDPSGACFACVLGI